MKPWFATKLERLDRLAALEDGWDGDGSSAPAPLVIDTARRLTAVLAMLAEVAPTTAPQFVPTVAGGVDIVWHAGGWNVEIEIPPDGTIEVWARHKERGIEFSYPEERA